MLRYPDGHTRMHCLKTTEICTMINFDQEEMRLVFESSVLCSGAARGQANWCAKINVTVNCDCCCFSQQLKNRILPNFAKM